MSVDEYAQIIVAQHVTPAGPDVQELAFWKEQEIALDQPAGRLRTFKRIIGLG